MERSFSDFLFRYSSERINLLEQRLFTEDEQQIKLALEGLTGTFETRGLRRVGSFVVAGRIPPQDWQPQNLIPNNFHGRLIQILNQLPWNYSSQDKKEAWQQEINTLAQQFCENKELLKSEMEWLTSPKAMMVENLGNAMGTYDANAVCLDLIMQLVADTEATGLARGYIAGLLRNHPQHKASVNEWIDKFETEAPAIAYELFRAGGNATRAVERALKLVDKGSLSLEYFDGFLPTLLTTEEFYEILSRLVISVREAENESASQTAMKLLAIRLESERRENHVSILEETNIQNLVRMEFQDR